jgi:sulfite reductase (NADPH) flavoprotein alpha-component
MPSCHSFTSQSTRVYTISNRVSPHFFTRKTRMIRMTSPDGLLTTVLCIASRHADGQRAPGAFGMLGGQMSGELKQPFTGRHVVNIKLTGPGSEKDTRHHEISLESAPVTYLPGDALGIPAQNSPALVERVIQTLDANADDRVLADGRMLPLSDALTDVYNLATPSRRLLEMLIARGAEDLRALLDRANSERLKRYLTGWNEAHDVLDALEDHPTIRLTAAELVGTLRKIIPKLYSIASSQKAHPDQVDLLVVSVRYPIRGRVREGICSTWLADRWPVGALAEMYSQNQQRHFAMPESGDTPLIMVGPGTGLAPFRAFIEERRVVGARGRNWLFFGEQRRASNFFYEDQFLSYVNDRFLRLDTAFSRDQAQKIYVQHRMCEHAHDLWAWLEEGAEFFVCGDKERMATDVDAALHQIVETHGGRTPEQAREYVENLKNTKRYKRDVY